jgi:hypothetical protein
MQNTKARNRFLKVYRRSCSISWVIFSIRLDQVDHIDGYKAVERKKKKSRKQREEHIEDTTPLDANGELWSTVYHLIDKSNDTCITVDGEGPEQTKKKKKSKHRDDDESTAMVVDERELPSEMNVVGLN